MHVKMLIGKLAGSVQEVPHHVGESLLMMGQAERVEEKDGERPVETATTKPAEQATARPAKARGKK